MNKVDTVLDALRLVLAAALMFHGHPLLGLMVALIRITTSHKEIA